MIDHIGIVVSDMERSKAFYTEALKPLDYSVVLDYNVAVGFGHGGKPDFWIATAQGSAGTAITSTHIALGTNTKEIVDAFYDAAIKAGGKDNGKPGLRPMYHPGYYGAFVLDPDGHNIEVVCHQCGSA
ncbi:Glyoxalase/Bleomycin resistance protein/Dihydroxybiphenyl dioxygenase [Gaertneriomyces semiglobifer]|nr:Glyoxalase/Bleomycin resistance protein/Dihydroxybiphenyl dioxygenase [Gaertneriomyces semiglobifer]